MIVSVLHTADRRWLAPSLDKHTGVQTGSMLCNVICYVIFQPPKNRLHCMNIVTALLRLLSPFQ